MGGVGKTALALVFAHRLKDRYPAAQFFLNLRGADPEHRPPATSAEIMQAVIHAFQPEARLPDTLDALAPIYCSVLTEAGPALLLLDNAAGADQVRPLLPPPNCLLLVTSRAHFILPGLATRNLDCLPPAKSRHLLLRLAERLHGHEKEAADLCGHLPLALEVFAGAVNDKSLTPVPALLARLRAHKDKLAPVQAAFEVSYDLLPEELRRCWRLLAVFPSSFDLHAAAAVWADVPLTPALSPSGGEGVRSTGEGETGLLDSAREAMQALVNASLVEWNEANGRFRLHDLVRQFGEDKLREPAALEASEEMAARLRHARHYRDAGEEAERLYLKGGEDVLRGLGLFDRERTHIEAAFECLAHPLTRTVGTLSPSGGEGRGERERERTALLVSLVNAVVYTGQELRFHPRQRIRWLEAQRDAARLAKDREQEGNALGNLGITYAVLGDAHKAIELYEQALTIKREIGDKKTEASILGNLGVAYKNSGDVRKAIEFYERALAIGREIGDRHVEGNALGNLGVAYAALDDARKAIEFYLQCLQLHREIGDRRGEGQDLGNLGNAHAALGETRKAIEFYEQRLVIAREIGDRRGEGNALWNSADEYWKLDDRVQAIARAEAALRIYEAIEFPNAAQVRAQLAQWRAAASP